LESTTAKGVNMATNKILRALFMMLAAGAVTANAYLGEVVNSFPAPGIMTYGLGHGQKYLYANVGGSA
jgi:hypothetical protein